MEFSAPEDAPRKKRLRNTGFEWKGQYNKETTNKKKTRFGFPINKNYGKPKIDF